MANYNLHIQVRLFKVPNFRVLKCQMAKMGMENSTVKMFCK